MCSARAGFPVVAKRIRNSNDSFRNSNIGRGKGGGSSEDDGLARRRGRGDVLNYDELFALERGGVNFLNTIEFVCVAPWRRRRVLVFKSRGSVQT